MVTELGKGVISAVATSLPREFLALCVVNVIFVLAVVWFLVRQTEITIDAEQKILQQCIEAALATPGIPRNPTK